MKLRPPIRDLPLRVVEETDLLPRAGEVAELRRAAAPGAWLDRSAPPPAIAESEDELRRRVDGAAAPSAAAIASALGADPLSIFRITDALVAPAFGAVIGPQGEVYRASVLEALHRWPDLAGLPGVRVEGEALLSLPAPPPSRDRAAVFMPWGGGFNYGHFIIDGLAALLALEEAGLLADFPLIAPPLKRWQAEALSLAFPKLRIETLRAPYVAVDEVIFASPMRAYLHRPDALLSRLAQRFCDALPRPERGGRRVYLSRRGLSMRVMLNEAAFEAALALRGFEIVRPQRLSFSEQALLMRETDVLVGASGAALANALFLSPGARVIEIQPANFTSFWLRHLTLKTGAQWYGYYCASPAPAADAPWTARLRRGFQFAYRLPLEDVLAFVDRLL